MPKWLEKETKEAEKNDEEAGKSADEDDNKEGDEKEELTEEELVFRTKQKQAWERK